MTAVKKNGSVGGMKIFKRYLEKQVTQDLKRKMVFLGGARQVGKTILAKEILGKEQGGYLSWDVPDLRERILKRELPTTKTWVFDEVHKYRHWRNYLKGVYDQHHKNHRILVTGSGRLDLYRRGGDSLQGRYHFLRLHPLSFAELGMKTKSDLLSLLTLGGFPEPFFEGSETETKRWSREYRQRIIQEDLVSLEQVHDLGNLELLMIRLPDLVGSPLSINSIREDLQVSHKSVANWLNILERLYSIFRAAPFGAPKLRALKKEQKHYHFDWGNITDHGARFENLVACHLLKWVHYLQDTQARELDLQYFRDVDGREVDFIVTERSKPLLAIECKWNDDELTRGIRYFKNHFPSCEAWQISAIGTKDYISKEKIRVAPAPALLKTLV